jgi:transglutaminase-like putative cysteine protease
VSLKSLFVLKILLICSTILLSTNFLNAQDKVPATRNFKFGKVLPEEFETNVRGTDSSARGVKLFDVGRMYFEISSKSGGFVYIFERHVRYKVLNKSGYDLADLSVELYHGQNGSEEKLDYMDAATYNMDGKVMSISKLSKSAKFSEKFNKNYTVKKFTLPNVKVGSIVEYKYKIKSDFIFNLRDWMFQSSVPTLYSDFDVRIPEYFRYKVNANSFVPLYQLKKEEINETYNIPASNGSPASNVNAKALEIRYIAEDVPAIKTESFITTIDDYIAKVEFELNSTHFPNEPYKEYTSTWPKIVSELMDDDTFGKFLTRSSFSKDLVPTIIKTETDPQLKMQLIYNYVRSTLKWNDSHSKYTTLNTVKAVLDKKSGNTADINLSLVNLLNAAGVIASPVLVSTRENGTHPGYPLINKFNNVIVQATIDTTTYLLDATDKNLNTGLLSTENLAHQGLKIDIKTKTAEWISLEQFNTSKENSFYSLVLTEDNKLVGTISRSYNNYSAVNRRSKYTSALNEAEYIKDLKIGKPGLEIKNYKIDNLNNPSEYLTEVMDVSIDDNVEEAGNLAMLYPLLYERTKENLFKMEERNYPVDFAYPMEENCRVNIEYPKNYQLEKLPKNSKMILPGKEASFTFMYASEGNILTVSSKIQILKSVFTVEEYHMLRELFKNIVEKQAQHVVFKKI